eukprot:1719822-Rhodomonas_salina.5
MQAMLLQSFAVSGTDVGYAATRLLKERLGSRQGFTGVLIMVLPGLRTRLPQRGVLVAANAGARRSPIPYEHQSAEASYAMPGTGVGYADAKVAGSEAIILGSCYAMPCPGADVGYAPTR